MQPRAQRRRGARFCMRGYSKSSGWTMGCWGVSCVCVIFWSLAPWPSYRDELPWPGRFSRRCFSRGSHRRDRASEVEVEAVSGNANTSAMQAFQNKMNAMDQSRDNFLLPKFGATSYNMDRETLEALPQGDTRQSTKCFFRRRCFLRFSGEQSRLPCPQRICERAIQDQWHPASRGGFLAWVRCWRLASSGI